MAVTLQGAEAKAKQGLDYLKSCNNYDTRYVYDAIWDLQGGVLHEDRDMRIALVQYLVREGFAKVFVMIVRSFTQVKSRMKSINVEQAIQNLKLLKVLCTNFTFNEQLNDMKLELVKEEAVVSLLSELETSTNLESSNQLTQLIQNLNILENIVDHPDSIVRTHYRESKAVDILMQHLKSKEVMVQIKCLSILSYIVNDEESSYLASTGNCIRHIVDMLKQALESKNDTVQFSIAGESYTTGLYRLLDTINRIAVNDVNKEEIVKQGAVSIITKVIQRKRSHSVTTTDAISTLWKLSFDKGCRKTIRQHLIKKDLRCVAQYDFDAQTAEDLPFKKGDVLLVSDNSDKDWWFAKRAETGQEGIIPSNYVTEEAKDVNTKEWYFGKISRREAETKLLTPGFTNGTFLIRESETKPGMFSLSVRQGATVKHFSIETQAHNQGFLVCEEEFPTLNAVVLHYQNDLKILTDPCAKDQTENTHMYQMLTEFKTSDDPALRDATTGLLWELNLIDIHERKKRTLGRQSSATLGSHIFISYSWKNQALVLKLKRHLEGADFTVWMDLDKMGGNVLEAMASAVEKSAAVILCVSSGYKESTYCQKEANYSIDCKKAIVPLIMEEGYKADGWLGFIISGILYFNAYSEDTMDTQMPRIIKELNSLVEAEQDY